MTTRPIPSVEPMDKKHSVTLPLQDWLAIQTQLSFAACVNDERGEHATAAVTRDLLERLRPQTMPAIEAAAEADCAERCGVEG